MYEASFGLKRRPFAATPDATCFLSSDPIRAALDEIVVCVEHGQGIAVLTAPAGTGKTLLCERLRCELDDRYETVFLRHASFLTRRALLQTILCELNSPYHHPSEQELRLELLPAIRALQPKREALVLICDEAHQLPDSLLEELRILADFAESGRPLVRLVLVGQLSLEEKLAQPGLDAFNQRIRAHVSLSIFDHAASLDYIDYRLTWSGGRTDEIFTPQAVDLIASVSDGIPRCINQLADHTLLLAFVAEQRPAGEELVREALSDLRQLPLHWNEPPQSLSSSYSQPLDQDGQSFPESTELDLDSTVLQENSITRSTVSDEPAADLDVPFPHEEHSRELFADVAELTSHDYLAFDRSASHEANLVDITSDDWRHTLELFNSTLSNAAFADSFSCQVSKTSTNSSDDEHSISQESDDQSSLAQAACCLHDQVSESSETASHEPLASPSPVTNSGLSTSDFQEEIIVDRYAAIDAGLEPPESSALDTSQPLEVQFEQFHTDPFSVNSLATFDDSSAVDPIASSSESLEDLNDSHPSSWEGTFSIYSSGPAAEKLKVKNEGAIPVVDRTEVFIPTNSQADAVDLSSESLLQAIRKEVDDLTSSVGLQTDPISLGDSNETAWESVETPQPQQLKAEARPFRYLFSKLRRKQQGLS